MGGTGGTESLNELGLVPQSVLMVKWEDEGMNGTSSGVVD
jgi:tether containing UBX domain for GLUT4